MNIYKNLPTWQKEIGYIPQSIYLSDDTIRNNVAFGIDESEIDEQTVISALQQAQLYDFVDTLPEGLDTYVGAGAAKAPVKYLPSLISRLRNFPQKLPFPPW